MNKRRRTINRTRQRGREEMCKEKKREDVETVDEGNSKRGSGDKEKGKDDDDVKLKKKRNKAKISEELSDKRNKTVNRRHKKTIKKQYERTR